MRATLTITICLLMFGTAVQAQELTSEKEKLSYSYGWTLGEQFKQTDKFDIESIITAINDASGTADPRLSVEEMASLRQAFQQQMRVEQAAALRELAAENIIKSEEFLAKNKLKTGVVVLPSGVQYRIIDEGEGARPNMDSTVMIHYRGSKMDEREFVSTFSTGTPEAVQISSEAVLPGWKDVLPLMKTGSSWQVFIPPELGFGERVNQNFGIGPNEALRFDIKLIEIVTADSVP